MRLIETLALAASLSFSGFIPAPVSTPVYAAEEYPAPKERILSVAGELSEPEKKLILKNLQETSKIYDSSDIYIGADGSVYKSAKKDTSSSAEDKSEGHAEQDTKILDKDKTVKDFPDLPDKITVKLTKKGTINQTEQNKIIKRVKALNEGVGVYRCDDNGALTIYFGSNQFRVPANVLIKNSARMAQLQAQNKLKQENKKKNNNDHYIDHSAIKDYHTLYTKDKLPQDSDLLGAGDKSAAGFPLDSDLSSGASKYVASGNKSVKKQNNAGAENNSAKMPFDPFAGFSSEKNSNHANSDLLSAKSSSSSAPDSSSEKELQKLRADLNSAKKQRQRAENNSAQMRLWLGLLYLIIVMIGGLGLWIVLSSKGKYSKH